MKKSIIVLILMSTFTLFCVIQVFASWVVVDANNANPVTGQWIGGDGTGVVSNYWETVTTYTGNGSIRWKFSFGSSTNNWPTIEILNGNKNWTGATAMGVWMYYDLTGTKTGWTIEPSIMYPFPTGYVLGNWDSGLSGVPNNTWIYNTWTGIDTIGDISNVTHIRFNFHDGDGWAPLAKSNDINIYLDDITLEGLDEPPVSASYKVFDMEGTNPVTNMWGSGGGSIQTTSIESIYSKHGSQSVRWRYTFGAPTTDDYPTIELAVPVAKSNWTGATKLGSWILYDLAGVKNGWNIQPNIQHPWPTSNDLGNWNDSFGVSPKQWFWREWDLTGVGDISNVTHMRWYYHAGDGWAGVASASNVDIYLDDISINTTPVPVELSDFSME